MLTASPHRGAPGAVVVHGRTALGVSLAEADDASLSSDEELAAVIAGTLDNRGELTDELARMNVRVPGGSAADTVLAAFRAWGDDAPVRFRGPLAGAVSDGTRLRCFRDHLGFGTLFLRDDDERFYAASEARQVLAGAQAERAPDLDAVTDIFYGRLAERRTSLRGVERLPRASLAAVGPTRGWSPERYWDPRDLLESARVTAAEAQELLVQTMSQAVRRCLSGRDALSLSGGLDSSTIAAFAASQHLALGDEPLTAIAAVYPDYPSVDERRYIELVSEHLGLRLHTFVQRSSPLDDLSYWVDALDGPWDTLPIQETAEQYRIAAELGSRRMLTGEMAEAVITMGGPLFGHFVSRGRFRPAWTWVAEHRSRGRTRQAMARELVYSVTPSLALRGYLKLRHAYYRAEDLQRVPRWVSAEAFPLAGSRDHLLRPVRDRWAEVQLGPTLAGVGPAGEADELCAALLGVEVRQPFADVDLWEFFLSLPAEVKFPDFNNVSKQLVRNTMRGRLPDELLDRRDKTYFNEHITGTADYEGLRGWLIGSEFRVEGVDYETLASRLDGRDFNANDVVWAYDLARVHAFVNLFV
jgi:asparagine synthetase B (glutamine-hydrolysing)